MDWTHQEAQAVWVADGREGQDARIFPKDSSCVLPACPLTDTNMEKTQGWHHGQCLPGLVHFLFPRPGSAFGSGEFRSWL